MHDRRLHASSVEDNLSDAITHFLLSTSLTDGFFCVEFPSFVREFSLLSMIIKVSILDA